MFSDRKILSWSLYDWANSACSTTVMAAFFPAFLTDYWSVGVDATVTTARLGVANSTTSILVALITPTLGALADQRGYKKLFCFVFMLLGVASTAALAFVGKGDWLLALIVFGICMIGFNASLVFYDSLLPSISNSKTADYASSLGYSLGYLGGGIIFLVNILMCIKPQWFGLADAVEGVKASFISVAIWWLVFSIPLFKDIPEPAIEKTGKSLWHSVSQSRHQLLTTFKTIIKDRNLLLFLIAFWLYIDGVYTVITMAVDYGKALQLDNNAMMASLLLVQFLGFPFALVFSSFADRWGCRIPILISIAVYTVSVILATWMNQTWHFYALAAMIGIVQGGVQALSRSMFSKMIPAKNAGEYFGLFNLVGKSAAILGPLIVGLGAYLSGNSRFGMLGLIILFILGGGLLLKVKEPAS
jgi:MFS transporter, UMF1 family